MQAHIYLCTLAESVTCCTSPADLPSARELGSTPGRLAEAESHANVATLLSVHLLTSFDNGVGT